MTWMNPDRMKWGRSPRQLTDPMCAHFFQSVRNSADRTGGREASSWTWKTSIVCHKTWHS